MDDEDTPNVLKRLQDTPESQHERSEQGKNETRSSPRRAQIELDKPDEYNHAR